MKTAKEKTNNVQVLYLKIPYVRTFIDDIYLGNLMRNKKKTFAGKY